MGGLSRVQWRKSSHSASGEQCVEVGYLDGHIFARDSKNPTGHILTCKQTEWSAFLNAAKNGNLDLP
jgi:Domain of unknown function (DUF397)